MRCVSTRRSPPKDGEEDPHELLVGEDLSGRPVQAAEGIDELRIRKIMYGGGRRRGLRGAAPQDEEVAWQGPAAPAQLTREARSR